jgi:hypothetical protein
MLSSILKFTTGQRGAIPLAVLAALLLAALGWVYAQGLRLDAARADAVRQIQAERVAHDETRLRLAAASHEIVRLESALDMARSSTAAVQESLRQALGREAEAAGAAAARKRILDQMRTRPRTEEPTEVIDDATRTAVVDRINRPL